MGVGSVTVEWNIEGIGASVDVAAGPTPDVADHALLVTVAADASKVRLDGLGSGRSYISIHVRGTDHVVVTAERRLVFEGLQNFRDLGGYRTAGGGHTIWGQVFRADSLHKLTATDLVAFERLGVRVVYDLRGDEERTTHPNPIDSIQLAVIGQPRDGERRAYRPTDFQRSQRR